MRHCAGGTRSPGTGSGRALTAGDTQRSVRQGPGLASQALHENDAALRRAQNARSQHADRASSGDCAGPPSRLPDFSSTTFRPEPTCSLQQSLPRAGDQAVYLLLHDRLDGLLGARPCGHGRFGVVPNRRQISGRWSYTSQPLGPRCTQLYSASAASCSASLFTGRRASSCDDAVTGPQQS